MTLSSSSPSLHPGEIVAGKYRVEELLGEGGMGLVFAATHLGLEQRVAIKVLRPEVSEKAEAVERFTREARAAAKIQSQHVARVLDIAFLDSGAPYIVMEYLEGEDLAQVLGRDGALDPTEAVRHVLAACEALAELHAQGIVHRDLKPANLFLAQRPDGARHVKLLDFGISKQIEIEVGSPESKRGLTRTAAVLGSPRYMSPEQLRSSRDVDARSDIWALGVTLFELLSAEAPFTLGTLAEVCAAILKDAPRPLGDLRPDLPPDLVSAVTRCLEKDPDARFEDLVTLTHALAPHGGAEGPLSADRVSGTLARGIAPHPDASVPPIGSAPTMEVGGAACDASEGRPTVPPPTRTKRPAAATITAERTGEILARLGDRSRVLRVAVERDAMGELPLEPKAAFLLSRVDGASTVDDILDVCGMPQTEALEVLDRLLDQRLVVIDASPTPR